MKKLIIINGTMGVGKTTVSKEVHKSLDRSVWLDGDWCWMMNPWVFSEENIQMVMDNITYLLRNYLTNSTFDYVILSWVLHKEEIRDELLDRLSGLEFQVETITLTCSETALRKRMEQDQRTEEEIKRSVDRLQGYKNMQTNRIDTSNVTMNQVVEQVRRIIRSSGDKQDIG
ncbi:nucleotide kinase [Paenibacillus sp. FSL H7-0326]|uniref:AAA family ATPase n=1 Tax=Paenibacillus sp. FSL H7-0326 TaxID=1921144 RepID=UPI00096E6ED2|nr:AAA family ATPase [Paenibacillus sp. FSL H7-0326]OMC71738.1 nucleotide kinase [Paenibacillus sp. FSL H7-0326]